VLKGYCILLVFAVCFRFLLLTLNFSLAPHSFLSHYYTTFHSTLSVHHHPSRMDKFLTWYDSEFPSLSNNPQLGNAGQTNLWATGGRNLGAPIPRNQATPISSQPSQQQDDLFSSSSRLSSAQGSFRFGNPPSATQGSQSQGTSVDEFPPLNRNANGDIGQERGTNLMSSFGFGATGAASAPTAQPNRVGNGLLNALSANSRATEVLSPASGEFRSIRAFRI
jgi:hypothetical protein